MNGWFPRAPSAEDSSRAPIENLDQTGSVQEDRERWSLPATLWRAHRLAESVFEGAVGIRVQPASIELGRGDAYPFRALVHLSVPFEDLNTHRDREEAFIRSAALDPVLCEVPMVYVFGAVVEESLAFGLTR